MQQDKISVIILTAQPNRKIKSYGTESLFKICDKITLIDYQLNTIHKALKNFNYEVIIITGHQSHRILNNTPDNVIKIENHIFNETNSLYNLKLGLMASTGNRAVIINGNIVFNQNTISGNIYDSSLLVNSYNIEFSDFDIGCTADEQSNVCYMTYGLKANKWSHILYLCDNELRTMRKICSKQIKERYFIFEAINEMIDVGGIFKLLFIKNIKLIHITSIKDLLLAGDIID